MARAAACDPSDVRDGRPGCSRIVGVVWYRHGDCAVWVAARWMRPAGATLFVLLCSFGQWMIFYALEAKPYATDAFWALLLPALAVWATEAGRELSTNLRRSIIWWITATVGLWISYGAIFVAPACAVVLVRGRVATWRLATGDVRCSPRDSHGSCRLRRITTW